MSKDTTITSKNNYMRPRIAVVRSNRYITAQLIDDATSSTLASVQNQETKSAKSKNDQALLAAQILAKKALHLGITYVRFDRRTFRYHGRVSLFADELRKQGLLF